MKQIIQNQSKNRKQHAINQETAKKLYLQAILRADQHFHRRLVTATGCPKPLLKKRPSLLLLQLEKAIENIENPLYHYYHHTMTEPFCILHCRFLFNAPIEQKSFSQFVYIETLTQHCKEYAPQLPSQSSCNKFAQLQTISELTYEEKYHHLTTPLLLLKFTLLICPSCYNLQEIETSVFEEIDKFYYTSQSPYITVENINKKLRTQFDLFIRYHYDHAIETLQNYDKKTIQWMITEFRTLTSIAQTRCHNQCDNNFCLGLNNLLEVLKEKHHQKRKEIKKHQHLIQNRNLEQHIYAKSNTTINDLEYYRQTEAPFYIKRAIDIQTMVTIQKKLHHLGLCQATVSELRNLFNGTPLTHPILWTGKLNALRTFILEIKKLEGVEYQKRNFWEKVSILFRMDGNKLINTKKIVKCRQSTLQSKIMNIVTLLDTPIFHSK
ncbi:hypothetical protein K4L44_05380 [Halosquirtibacter laminarini]|uniref:Uncharacterized protein n=1 Tax=Halosquirtibacter laminarini TaxID=3374600 RepID=A0AC61NHW2_9BACT|nr:hypothetical protein K4L44_05380 [Prolixibacteraceae bacterium]